MPDAAGEDAGGAGGLGDFDSFGEDEATREHASNALPGGARSKSLGSGMWQKVSGCARDGEVRGAGGGVQAAAVALRLRAWGDVSLGKLPAFDGRGAAERLRQRLPCAGFRDGPQRLQLL